MIKKIENNGWGVVKGLTISDMFFGEGAWDKAKRKADEYDTMFGRHHIMIVRLSHGTRGEASKLPESILIGEENELRRFFTPGAVDPDDRWYNVPARTGPTPRRYPLTPEETIMRPSALVSALAENERTDGSRIRLDDAIREYIANRPAIDTATIHPQLNVDDIVDDTDLPY